MGVAVKRYPFPEPEWCRTIWPSPQAREVWEPRLSAISAAWQAVELATVGPVRLAARVPIHATEFPAFSRKASARGLVAVALQQEATSGSYQARPSGMSSSGDRWHFQAALCATPATARAFVRAWERSDDRAIGSLLGFPACCVEAFQRIWNEEQWSDTTWPMARASLHRALDRETEVEIHAAAPVEANILLRWLGVRWVPHLPCAFDCAATVAFGQQFRDVMRNGFGQEAAWIDELLNSSIEWSAWRGIAEIKTPVLKISAKTDATVERLIVRRPGPRVPAAAVTGNAFPYKPAPTVAPLTFHGRGEGLVSKPLLFLVGDDGPERFVIPDSHEWTDNGFHSLEAMTSAHSIVQYVVQVGAAARQDARILDLGSGNGRLVRSLTTDARGVEQDRNRRERSRARGVITYPQTIEEFVALHPAILPFDVVLLMPGRLIEMAVDDAIAVRRWLKAHAAQVVVYAYGDWLNKYDGLTGLCAAAGLPAPGPGASTDHVAAALLNIGGLTS